MSWEIIAPSGSPHGHRGYFKALHRKDHPDHPEPAAPPYGSISITSEIKLINHKILLFIPIFTEVVVVVTVCRRPMAGSQVNKRTVLTYKIHVTGKDYG